jgi:hypothetical protein
VPENFVMGTKIVDVVPGRVSIEAATTPVSSIMRAVTVTVPPDPTVVGEMVGGKMVGGVVSVPPITAKLPPARIDVDPQAHAPSPANTVSDWTVHVPDAAAGGTAIKPC